MSTLKVQSSTGRLGGVKGLTEDFVILCPAEELNAALAALYYLPRNYKLVVRSRTSEAPLAQALQDDAYLNRVTFESTGTSDQDTPVSFADAVLHSDKEQTFAKRAARQINVQDAGTPEALASAILKAARA